MSEFVIPTSTASSLVANAISVIKDPGMLLVLLVVVGVPFGFYIMKKISSVIPKR
jgi:hypothetical protein